MYRFVLGLLILSSTVLASAQQSIRQVDFKNFTYPLSGPRLGHDRLVWMDPSIRPHIRLINGKDDPNDITFTLDSVTFADVTGDGEDSAIVTLDFHSGGTQQSDYVLQRPKLLGYFHAGDRAYSGLYKVYGDHGKLVVEVLDPTKRQGDCCSAGFIRTRYEWRNGRFEAFGKQEFGPVPMQ